MTDPHTELIAPIEAWIAAVDDANVLKAPQDFQVGYGAVHQAIALLLETGNPDHAPDLLTALAACEFFMAEHPDFTTEAGLPPIQPLPSGWLAVADDGSSEFRLAASLISLRPVGLAQEDTRIRPFRTHLEPVAYRLDQERFDQERFDQGQLDLGLDATSLSWDFHAINEVVWDKESDVDGFNAIFARRLKMWDASVCAFGQGAIDARLGDIDRFVRGQTDEAKLSRLCFSLSLIDAWHLAHDPLAAPENATPENASEAGVDPAFALAKLCYVGRDDSGHEIPLNRDIHLLANRGDLDTALEFGAAHLRKHGVDVSRDKIATDLDSRRVAAALLFPIGDDQRDVLAKAIRAK